MAHNTPKHFHTLSSLGSQDLFWLKYPLSSVHAGGLEAHRLPVMPDSIPKIQDFSSSSFTSAQEAAP